mmetsp:Transcript_8986/g.27277  ORF Transcript_8986/g.27277 Transcript_8986/m.27277 type:complete len:214 (-) Transcript_8986:130-771(-)
MHLDGLLERVPTWQTAAPGLPTGSRSERLGRRQHGHAHRVCTDAFVVCLGIRAPLRGVHHALIRRLVEERVWNQDHRGNGNQHLQKCGRARLPRRATPCAKQREAHLPAVVQVWVEAHTPLARGEEMNLRRVVGVVWRQQDVKNKGAERVGGVGRGQDERPQHVHALRIDGNKDGAVVAEGQAGAESADLLCYALEALAHDLATALGSALLCR